MVAFGIFWCAAFAILFFILGVIFKALASAFNALLTTLVNLIALGVLVGLVELAIYMLCSTIQGIITEGFFAVLGSFLMFAVALVIFIVLVGGLGFMIFGLMVSLVSLLAGAVSSILDWIAETCEKQYARMLKSLINRIDKL
ncbi:hypothetical protein [Oribacterium sp. FC2011]|uniref:hypothetical protein n=1 Tax=Oribacterium sp. FC2011 TaxID=1408311 RepID=UPI0004E28C27|nr:hypothetical protein [Oribacterium sp. FC2011]